MLSLWPSCLTPRRFRRTPPAPVVSLPDGAPEDPRIMYVVCDQATGMIDVVNLDEGDFILLHRDPCSPAVIDHFADAADMGRAVELRPAILITGDDVSQLKELAAVLAGDGETSEIETDQEHQHTGRQP